MKEKIKELALQAGGSHYPEVGGDILELFADLLVKDVLREIDKVNTNVCCGTTYDTSISACVREKIVDHIKQAYDIKYKFLERVNDF
jgi:hypothetical protein